MSKSISIITSLVFLLIGLHLSCTDSTQNNHNSSVNETDTSSHTELQTKSLASQGLSDPETDDDCIFDLNSQTDEFIRDIPEFTNYSWNDSTKTATVLLKNGDTLYAQRGGCYHFGISGKLIKLNDHHKLSDIDHWLQEAKWISKRIMDKSDFNELYQMIKKGNYDVTTNNDRVYITFKGHNHSEWYLTVDWRNENVIIDTGYYYG